MKRPVPYTEEVDDRPCTEELRAFARRLVQLSVEMNECADAIDHGGNCNGPYWKYVKERQDELRELYEEFMS